MHKKAIIVLTIFLTTSLFVNAQSSNFADKKNAIRINGIAAFVSGQDVITYERILGKKTSLQLGIGYSNSKDDDTSFEYQNIGAGLEFRYYLKEAHSGFYTSPGVSYNFGDVSGGAIVGDINHNTLNFSLKAGYQWALKSSLILGIDIGVLNKNYSYSGNKQGVKGLHSNEIIPIGGLYIGYAF